MQSYIQDLIQREKLPDSFISTVERWYAPLANSIAASQTTLPIVIGVQGTQGSGKSTFATFLQALLQHEHQLHTVSLSLDDFYLTRQQRLDLAKNRHPLLAVRGVPGTHDLELAISTIKNLKTASLGKPVAVPRFDKSVDDRAEAKHWPQISAPVDVVIFEGWCVGCEAERDEALQAPINSLEKEEDSDGRWREFVNSALRDAYQALFALIDTLIVLQAPSFDCVLNWRLLQEQKLRARWEALGRPEGSRIQSEAEVERFIAHYERLTRHCLATLPEKADWLMPISADHVILDLIPKQ